jgi:hypothetical protein
MDKSKERSQCPMRIKHKKDEVVSASTAGSCKLNFISFNFNVAGKFLNCVVF